MSPPLLRLGLIITLRCNAECRHCFFDAGPTRDEVMSLELAQRAIDEAKQLGASWVSLTGGEPFLEPKLLSELIQYASSAGLNTEAVTNGFWAETIPDAKERLSSLRMHGLDVLNLSLDDFHREYIPVSSVRNAFNAAKELGIKTVIMTTTARNSEITADTAPELLQDENIQVLGRPRVRDPSALLIETHITPVGRGANITDHDYTLITEVKCGEALRDIGIGPNGDVYPCCGPLANKITLGNINDSSLKTILEKAERNPLMESIRKGANISGPFTSKCHACYSLAE